MVLKSVTARYRKKMANPFSNSRDNFMKKTAKVSEDLTEDEIKELAKEVTPEGYEFIEVKL